MEVSMLDMKKRLREIIMHLNGEKPMFTMETVTELSLEKEYIESLLKMGSENENISDM